MEETEIFDTNLLMEGKGTATTIFCIIEYPKALEMNLKVLWPEKADYVKAIEVMVLMFKKGTPLPAIDIIMASMCINRDLALVTKDKHFEHIQKSVPGFKLILKK